MRLKPCVAATADGELLRASPRQASTKRRLGIIAVAPSCRTDLKLASKVIAIAYRRSAPSCRRNVISGKAGSRVMGRLAVGGNDAAESSQRHACEAATRSRPWRGWYGH